MPRIHRNGEPTKFMASGHYQDNLLNQHGGMRSTTGTLTRVLAREYHGRLFCCEHGSERKDGEVTGEENISAAQQASAENTRFSASDEDREWAQGVEPPPGQGPPQTHRVGASCDSPARRGQARGVAKLSSSKVFQDLYSMGTSTRGSLVVLIYRCHEGRGTRGGVVASRKVGSAVRRNRAKRLMREVLRKVSFTPLSERGNDPGVDIILIARKGCERATMWEVKAEVEALVRRAVA